MRLQHRNSDFGRSSMHVRRRKISSIERNIMIGSKEERFDSIKR
jgi:hypothetical protein